MNSKSNKTRRELVRELDGLRRRLAELDAGVPGSRVDGGGSPGYDASFSNIVDASPMGIHIFSLEPDERLVFRDANEAADRILNIDHARYIGMTIEEAFPALADTEMPERYRKAAAEGVAWKTEQVEFEDYQITGAFEVHAFQTRPGEMAAMFIDITERRRVEEAIRKQSAALEQSADGIAIADLDGYIQFVNSAWAGMHGYTVRELIGKHLSLFHTEEQMQNEVIPFNEKMKIAGVNKGNVGHRRKDGTIFPTRMSSILLRDEHGSPVGMVGTALDISEEVKLEAQLRQAQKMESIGRLAGGIAHDFNNLLTPILCYADIATEGLSADDPYLNDLNEIKKAAERARDLARQLLAFGRKQVLEMKTVDLGKVVFGFEKILRRTVREDIELVTGLSSSTGLVRADVSQIEQVIMNLALNAGDAMPEGGRITIRTDEVMLDGLFAREYPGVEPGPHVVLSISDTGLGMDSETASRIFDPFFTTKEMGKGTGLGLSTVHGIIKQHKGAIQVESEPGKGTTFKIYFPRIEGAVEETSEPVQDHRAGTGSETILLAEDNEMVRRTVTRILEMHGYTVLACAGADECIEIAGLYEGDIHMLLTDVVMPRMNGGELYHQLLPGLPGLRVLFMSGYTDDTIVQSGVLEDGVDFIQKPVSVRSLTFKVREVLDRVPPK